MAPSSVDLSLENEVVDVLRHLVWAHAMGRVHDDLHATAMVRRLGDEVVLVELALEDARAAPRAAHAAAEDDLLEVAGTALADFDGARFEEDDVGRDGGDCVDCAVPFDGGDGVNGVAVAVDEEAKCLGGKGE